MSCKGVVEAMSTLKRKLKNGEVVLGTWITINHPDVVDALSELPLDWLVFDMEHAPLELSDIEILLMPLRGVDISPIIRVPWNDMVIIKRALDIGAEGILVPWVNSREEAERAVSYASYPPRGLRGVGPRRAVRYGQRSFLDYYENFERNERILLVQIETGRALENLEEILSTPGIDVAYIGPMDLSVSLGIPLRFGDSRFQEALKKVRNLCEKYGVTPGIHAFSPEQAQEFISQDFKFIALMSDLGIMRRGFISALTMLGRLKEEAGIGY